MQGLKIIAGALAATVTAVVAPAPVYAYVQPIWLEANQSYYLKNSSKVTRIAVANPEIADISVVNHRDINIVAKKPGSTTLNVWTSNGMRQEFRVSVSPADAGLAQTIQKAIKLPHVKVEKIGNKILLRGIVENQRERNLAVQIAGLYADGLGSGTSGQSNTGNTSSTKNRRIFNDDGSVTVNDEETTHPNVVDLLELNNPEQINVEALVIEVDSNNTKDLGFTYGAASRSSDGTRSASGSSTMESGTYYAGETNAYNGNRSKGSHWYSRNWFFTHFSDINIKLNALITNGKARIISRPNITTMSGKTAGVHVGGKVLIPKTDSNGSTSYDEKNYGIELDLVKPEVDRDGNITANLYTSVSRLDYTNGITVDGNVIPGIADRTATSVVNIPTGMTMAIAGLMNSEESDTISKVPVLSKIPVLGDLFKYHNKTHNKSEILVLITPRLVTEETPVKMSEKMREAYLDARKEDMALYAENVNEKGEPTSMQHEKKKDIGENQGGSMLEKYLDRDVLKKDKK